MKKFNNEQETLSGILDYLNANYYQDSDNYNLIDGARPIVFRYDEHSAVSLWACGAIVCIEHIMYFIQEDDGCWFVSSNGKAVQDCFSLGWSDSFINAMKKLQEYVRDNGTPVYYPNTEDICHYTL